MLAPIPPRNIQTTQAATKAAIRAELDGLGSRLAAFRDAASSELERLAAFRWVTERADLAGNEVAERAGVSRQTLVNLQSSERGLVYQWPIDLRVLLELGLGGPHSTENLIGSLGRVPIASHQVVAAIERLAAEGLIGVISRSPSDTHVPMTYWQITARGLEDLPRRLRHAAMPPSRTWTAYVVSSPAEANAIAEAGEKALGEHGTAVIPGGTVHGMDQPEVAFRVEASDPVAAQSTAVALFNELRACAGLGQRTSPVVVSALVAPQRS